MSDKKDEKQDDGLSRRDFMVAAAGATAASMAAPAIVSGAAPHELPPLPWKDDALAPHISANTIGFHYGKHHRAYLNNLNGLLQKPENAELAALPLEALIKAVAGKPDKAAFFNNAAQIWNHTFYWNSLRPQGGGNPPAALKQRIETDFGGFESFVKELSTAAVSQFGSGWAWIVLDGGKLKVTKTPNAETPLTTSAVPLLTLDVWEHAYYLDFQNRRPDYVDALIKNLINWEFVAENLAKAKA